MTAVLEGSGTNGSDQGVDLLRLGAVPQFSASSPIAAMTVCSSTPLARSMQGSMAMCLINASLR